MLQSPGQQISVDDQKGNKKSLSYSAIARLELRRRLIFLGRVDISRRCVLLKYITCPS